jgi:hypothetical protein
LLSPNGKIGSVNPIADNPLINLLIILRGSQPLKSVIVKPIGHELELLRKWIEANRLKTTIDHSYSLADAVDAQNYSESKHVLLVDEYLGESIKPASSPDKLPDGQAPAASVRVHHRVCST